MQTFTLNGKKGNHIGNAPGTAQLIEKYGINRLTASATTPTSLEQPGAGNVVIWSDFSIAMNETAAPSGSKISDANEGKINMTHGKIEADW